jgi:chorismate mutase|nr:MAG TPA: hypothetical protein [Caudoviricetes sp.]
MIKIKDGEVTLDGESIELMEEATQVVLEIIVTLVENDCLDVENIPKVIDTLTKELYAQMEAFTNKNNKRYN